MRIAARAAGTAARAARPASGAGAHGNGRGTDPLQGLLRTSGSIEMSGAPQPDARGFAAVWYKKALLLQPTLFSVTACPRLAQRQSPEGAASSPRLRSAREHLDRDGKYECSQSADSALIAACVATIRDVAAEAEACRAKGKGKGQQGNDDEAAGG